MFGLGCFFFMFKLEVVHGGDRRDDPYCALDALSALYALSVLGALGVHGALLARVALFVHHRRHVGCCCPYCDVDFDLFCLINFVCFFF